MFSPKTGAIQGNNQTQDSVRHMRVFKLWKTFCNDFYNPNDVLNSMSFSKPALRAILLPQTRKCVSQMPSTSNLLPPDAYDLSRTDFRHNKCRLHHQKKLAEMRPGNARPMQTMQTVFTSILPLAIPIPWATAILLSWYFEKSLFWLRCLSISIHVQQ